MSAEEQVGGGGTRGKATSQLNRLSTGPDWQTRQRVEGVSSSFRNAWRSRKTVSSSASENHAWTGSRPKIRRLPLTNRAVGVPAWCCPNRAAQHAAAGGPSSRIRENREFLESGQEAKYNWAG